MKVDKEFDATNVNIHNDISGIFELPLRNQSKMQLCKVNESKSRPDIALKRIGQELDKAETKCFTLKSELNYVMDVYRKTQTETIANKEAFDIPIITSPGSKSSIKHNSSNNEITSADRTTHRNSLHTIHNVDLKAEENFGTFNLSPRSVRFSSRKSIDDDIEKSECLMEGRQKGLLNVTITPRTQLDKKLPCSMQIQDEITEVGIKECESYYFPSSMSLERLMSQVDEDYLCVTQCSTRGNIEGFEGVEKSGLNVDTSNVAKARRTAKSKSSTGRNEMNSVYSAVFKARKRKAKLRDSVSKSTFSTSVSKNTFSTKNAGFRKEVKRRRHKDLGVAHQSSNPPKHVKKFNNVNIFNNIRLKNNNSGVSSKHSKTDGAKHEKKSHLPEAKENPRKIQKATALNPGDTSVEHVNRECQSYNKKDEQDRCLQTLNCQSNSGAKPEVAQKQDKSEKHPNDLRSSAQDETRQCKRASFNRNDRSPDPLFTPNYEIPTLASKLKRSDRSYFSRFNFRNIPFVVGTSVTPSYNLGLNIQQVLSMMKMRQSIANDVTPLLIRKVSRTMSPTISLLLAQMNGYYRGSVPDMSSQTTGTFNSGDNLGRDKGSPVFNLQQERKTPSGCMSKVTTDTKMISEGGNISKQLRKEEGDSCEHKTKQQSPSAVSKINTLARLKGQGIPGISLKGNVANRKIRMPDSRNSKEVRDALINLHDQFEEMNTKYERLQSQVHKSNDKSLVKELSALEKELSVKEEEINAVVSLYEEVMTLKQQMKMLNERNSLVCIATESIKETRKNPLAFVTPGKSRSMNSSQIYGGRNIYSAARELPASMQLAALLRQIQTYHKQLQLVS